MTVQQLQVILASCPADYTVKAREGDDRHKGAEWGDITPGNYTVDHENKQVRIWSEPI